MGEVFVVGERLQFAHFFERIEDEVFVGVDCEWDVGVVVGERGWEVVVEVVFGCWVGDDGCAAFGQ